MQPSFRKVQCKLPVWAISNIAEYAATLFAQFDEIPEDIEDFNDVTNAVGLWDGVPWQLLAKSMIEMHGYARWVSQGLPVFRISEDALAAYLLTDPSDVLPEEVQAPFEAFVIELPERFWNTDSGYIRLIVIHKYHVPEAHVGSVHKKAVDRINFACVTESGLVLHENIELPTDHPTIGAWLERVNEKNLLADADLSSSEYSAVKLARRLYVNLCLWISERGAGKKLKAPTKAYTKRQKELQKTPSPSVWLLGCEINLDRQLIRNAQDLAAEESGLTCSAAWQINKRFTVRGHWRNQACGKKLSEHKRIFIKPYWKGPKEGEKLSHLYKLARD
jgi:hypothetical protein